MSELTMKDVEQNPDQYGFCSFEEFRKNKARWRPDKEALLKAVDVGGVTTKLNVKDHKYYLEGYRCESLEAVESLAAQMGIPKDQIVSGGVTKEKVDNGKLRLHVHFMSKASFEKRKTW